MKFPFLSSRKTYLLLLAYLLLAISQYGSAQTQPIQIDDSFSAFAARPNNPSFSPLSQNKEIACGGGAKSSSSVFSWSTNGSEEIPGIYWATLLIKCQNDRTIVIWTDIRSYFGSGFRHDSHSDTGKDGIWTTTGSISDTNSIYYSYTINPNGEQFAVINDQHFDLVNGDVFLVSATRGEVTIKQIDYNLTSISAGDIKLLARSYPEIGLFFEEQVP